MYWKLKTDKCNRFAENPVDFKINVGCQGLEAVIQESKNYGLLGSFC